LAGRNTPSATDASLGLSARRSTSQRVDNVSGVGPTATSWIPATAYRATAPSAPRPEDAPLTVAMDVGPVADGHGTTGDDVGGANASSPNANVTPARQLTRLYPLFNGKKRAGSANLVGWERGGRTAQRVSSPPAAVAAVQAGEGIEGVAVRALNTSRAGGPPGKLPCAPPAPRLHAWFLEPRKRQRLWWSTGTAICQMAVPHHLRRWVRLGFCHGRHSRGDGPSRRQPLQIPRESILQGDDGISGEDPDDVDGDVANPVGDCALGDRPLTLRSG